MSLNVQQLFADNMCKRRKQIGYSQEKLAEISKLHRTYIGGIEQYVRNPSLKSMLKISNALKIDIWVLLNPDYDDIVKSEYSLCSYKNNSYVFYPVDKELIESDIFKLNI